PELRPYSAARSVTARRLYPSGGISVPAVIDLSLVAVGLGALVLLRLAGGSLPWGHLSIAVGPDGRPMRPRVKWHLWSVSRGEAPRLAVLAGFASVALGCASLAVTVPRIVQTAFHPIPGLASYALIVVHASSEARLSHDRPDGSRRPGELSPARAPVIICPRGRAPACGFCLAHAPALLSRRPDQHLPASLGAPAMRQGLLQDGGHARPISLDPADLQPGPVAAGPGQLLRRRRVHRYLSRSCQASGQRPQR